MHNWCDVTKFVGSTHRNRCCSGAVWCSVVWWQHHCMPHAASKNIYFNKLNAVCAYKRAHQHAFFIFLNAVSYTTPSSKQAAHGFTYLLYVNMYVCAYVCMYRNDMEKGHINYFYILSLFLYCQHLCGNCAMKRLDGKSYSKEMAYSAMDMHFCSQTVTQQYG